MVAVDRRYRTSFVLAFAMSILNLCNARIWRGNESIPTAAYFGRKPISTFNYTDCAVFPIKIDNSTNSCVFKSPKISRIKSTGCSVGVLDHADLAGTPCHFLMLAEMLHIIKNSNWTNNVSDFNALVFHRTQTAPGYIIYFCDYTYALFQGV